MSGKDLTRDRCREDHICDLTNVAKRRLIAFGRRAEALTGDDHHAATRCQSRQGGQNMLGSSLAILAIDMLRGGERRVHHNDRRLNRAIQSIIDRRRVVI